MKKKIIILILALAAVLFTPIPSGVYKDGGTRTFTALTYKVVRWRTWEEPDFTLEQTKVYFFPDNFKSYSALLERERAAWEAKKDFRRTAYTEIFLNRETAERMEDDYFTDVRITSIYENCFFAEMIVPSPYEIKLNGALPAAYCVGDQIATVQKNVYLDAESHRIEADLLSVSESNFELDPQMDYKPVIYLYPPEETEVSVALSLDGALTCAYPPYRDGWHVTAAPDGTLTDANGQTYNYLYWEGETYADYDFSEGFCVKGSDTAAFLEDALARLGLSRREANEFIVYWLPRMQENPYNLIAFQKQAYTDAARLSVTPRPDTLLRVFMAYQPLEQAVELPPQTLDAPARTGFTVVEWGGAEINRKGVTT